MTILYTHTYTQIIHTQSKVFLYISTNEQTPIFITVTFEFFKKHNSSMRKSNYQLVLHRMPKYNYVIIITYCPCCCHLKKWISFKYYITIYYCIEDSLEGGVMQSILFFLINVNKLFRTAATKVTDIEISYFLLYLIKWTEHIHNLTLVLYTWVYVYKREKIHL